MRFECCLGILVALLAIAAPRAQGVGPVPDPTGVPGNGLAATGPARALATAPRGPAAPASACLPVVTQNFDLTSAGWTGNLATFAILANTGANARQICSVDFFVATRSSVPATMTIWLHDRSAAGSPGNVLGTATMSVGASLGTCTATFATPVPMAAATDFFVAFDNRTDIWHPVATSGPTSVHYWNGPPTWSGPWTNSRWSFRVNCVGTAPAAFAPFGSGCAGSGWGCASCLASNYPGASANWVGSLANFAILANTGSSGRRICSVEFLVATRSATPKTMTVWLQDRAVGGAPGSILATGTMAVGATLGSCVARFSPAVTLPAATDFFVVFDNRVDILHPVAATGTLGTHYWNGPPTWSGPWTTARWSFQLGCEQPNAAPELSSSGLPFAGRSFLLDLKQGPPSAPFAMLLGGSNQRLGGLTLPFDLAPLGAPGCRVYVSNEIGFSGVAGTNGASTVPLAIPNLALLLGLDLFAEFFLVDPAVNTLGLTNSNAGRITIGDL